MQQINIHQAKTQFSSLLASVEKGEEIIIARYRKPVAKLVPFREKSMPRTPGSAKGKFTVPDDLLNRCQAIFWMHSNHEHSSRYPFFSLVDYR